MGKMVPGTIFSRRGSVLIVVVWVVTLLSLLVAGLGSQGVFALGLTDRLDDQLRLSYAARGGLSQALTLLAQDPSPSFDGTNEAWIDDEQTFARQPVGEGWVTVSYPKPDGTGTVYGLVDEDRKLNLNTAPEDVLERLLIRAVGLRKDEADRLVDAILDWRDTDREQRPYGAEDFYYSGYESKDGPFENLEELLLVRGMSQAIYARIIPSLTVYGSGRVNINTADAVVLQALGLSKTGVNGLVLYRMGEDNMEATADDRVLTSPAAFSGGELASYVPAEDINRLAQLAQDEVVGVGSEAFRMSVTAEAEDVRYPFTMECVVDRKGRIAFFAEH